ncbi:MAG: hypothetical protein QM673_08640 [Gordonia sp. (in: high G+C Gram-positive bacteria)]
MGARVDALLAQIDEIRAATDGAFDLAALARQSALFEQAHEALTGALAEVDRQ